MTWDALSRIGLTRDQMERRRMAAAKDLKAGMKQAAVARKYGVSGASVCRWAKLIDEEGFDGLKRRKAPGYVPRLSSDNRKRLRAMLVKGASKHGWATDLWTTKRVAELIEREFRVRYHWNHVGKLLRRLGFTWKKPRQVAREKDLDKKDKWIRTTWERVRKN